MTKELEKALRHIKTRADLWAVREVEKALEKLERWEKHYCFDCKYFTENEERYNEEHCSKCTLIGTEWEQTE